jgi:hypothetical protein
MQAHSYNSAHFQSDIDQQQTVIWSTRPEQSLQNALHLPQSAGRRKTNLSSRHCRLWDHQGFPQRWQLLYASNVGAQLQGIYPPFRLRFIICKYIEITSQLLCNICMSANYASLANNRKTRRAANNAVAAPSRQLNTTLFSPMSPFWQPQMPKAPLSGSLKCQRHYTHLPLFRHSPCHHPPKQIRVCWPSRLREG